MRLSITLCVLIGMTAPAVAITLVPPKPIFGYVELAQAKKKKKLSDAARRKSPNCYNRCRATKRHILNCNTACR